MSAGTPRLSSGARLALALVVSVVLGGVVAAGALAAAVYHAGTIDVEVEESGGEHVSIAVPASLVLTAVRFVPDSVLDEASKEVEPWWPVAREAGRQLADAPDAVYVRVDGPGLRVRVGKQDGRFTVDVEDHGDRVHVSVPASAIEAVARRLESRR